MMGAGWWCVETASGLLEPREREAVLGDLAEAGEAAWHGLIAVLGLALRRQVLLWKSWRPWVSAFGVVLPNSFQLMGFSMLVSSMFLQDLQRGLRSEELSNLLGKSVLLAIVAWSCGFAVGAISRRTLWVSCVACLLPCLFCFSRFAVPHRSPLSLLLFLPFAMCGGWFGLRRGRLRLRLALPIAMTATVLTISGWTGSWLSLLALLWPGWFLVAMARKQPARA